MPTLDWIRESAEDRYSEYLSTQRRERTRVRCPYCARAFDDGVALNAHVGLEHPLGIPGLFVQGRAAPSTLVVRQDLSERDFALLNCTECLVRFDGTTVQLPPTELAGWLVRTQPIHVEVFLANERLDSEARTSSEVRIEFRIPSTEDLDRCDRQFLDLLARPTFRMADVEAFVEAVPQEGLSREYSSALADYAMGVLLKDQAPGSGILGALREHKDKFMSALEVLATLARPVSEAVTSAIAFNLNAWDRLRPPPELPAFVLAADFFRELDRFVASESLTGIFGRTLRPICPIDQVTDTLLSAIRAIPEVAAGRPLPKPLGELIEGVAVAALTEFDIVKRGVIGSVVTLRLRESAAAAEFLADVRHDFHFGEWAEHKLGELK